MKRFAIRFNAPVVLSFAIISLLVLVLDSVTGGASTARLFCVYRAPLTDPLTYVRFFHPRSGPLGLQPLYGQYAASAAGGAGAGGEVRQPESAADHRHHRLCHGAGTVSAVPPLGPAWRQRRGVYDDRPVLVHGDEEGRHSSDHAAGGGPVLRQRDRRRPYQDGQRVPPDPHCGRRERHRVRLPAGPGEEKDSPLQRNSPAARRNRQTAGLALCLIAGPAAPPGRRPARPPSCSCRCRFRPPDR